MDAVECWYHYFLDRQAYNNFAAYLFLAHIGSILTPSLFQPGCYPPSTIICCSTIPTAPDGDDVLNCTNMSCDIREDCIHSLSYLEMPLRCIGVGSVVSLSIKDLSNKSIASSLS